MSITPKNRNRALRRHRQRGAAMVEAIVVMGTMLVFLGMNMWAFKAYGGKIDQANSTRRDALYFGSHTCEGKNNSDPDTYTDSQLAGNRSSGGQSSLSITGLITALRGGGGNFDFAATARSQKEPKDVTGSALTSVGSNGVIRTALTARVATNSAVGCNEKDYGPSAILGLLRMGLGAIKSLIGI